MPGGKEKENLTTLEGRGGVCKERARLYLIINILFLIINICGVHKCSILGGQERASYPPEPELQAVVSCPNVAAGYRPLDLLKEQCAFLTAEPSLESGDQGFRSEQILQIAFPNSCVSIQSPIGAFLWNIPGTRSLSALLFAKFPIKWPAHKQQLTD